MSSSDQTNDAQEARLREVGCAIIRSEKISGATREGRDELANVIEFIRDGDELVVVRLDRLGRSTRDVLNVIHELQSKGAALRVLEPAFSTNDAAGPILATVLGMVAEMERVFIHERQRVGIAAAKARGAYRGRKATVPVDRVRDMAAAGTGPSAIAQALKISRQSVYRALKGSAPDLAHA